MQLFGWSRFIFRFAALPLTSLRGSFPTHQLQLVSSTLSNSIAFLVLWQCPNICFSFRFLRLLLSGPSERQNPLYYIITTSSPLSRILWSGYISKSQRILLVSIFKTDSALCIYHLVVWSNFSFFHNSQWITHPIQSCLVFYSFSQVCFIRLLCDSVASYPFSF